MEIKEIYVDMKATFGELTFGKFKDVVRRRVNSTMKDVGREYEIFSSVQRADNIYVELPIGVALKSFDYDEKIELVNPRLVAEGYRIGEQAISRYKLLADDMIAVR